MPIRLLIITDVLVAGGIERNLAMLAPQLKTAGYDIRILCLYGPKSGKDLYFLPELEAAGLDVRVLNLAFSPSGKLKGILQIIRHVWDFRAEIVLAFNYHANLLSRLGRLFFPFRTPLIGTVRGRYTERQLRYERLSWWLCQKIVCNGVHLKQDLVNVGVPDKHVLVIPNGLDLNRFNPSFQSDLREQLDIKAKRIFLSVGRITREKMFHLTVEAIGKLKASGIMHNVLEYWILGSPDEPDMVNAIQNMIEVYNLQSVVRIFPVIDAPQVFYSACDATILYSPSEGLPNVVLESLAMGKPAIVSMGANGAQVITDGRDGWVVPDDDINSLSKIIAELLNLSDEDLSKFRNVCIRRAHDFSVEQMAKGYQTLFETMLIQKVGI